MNVEELAATLEAKKLNPDEFGIGEQRASTFFITDGDIILDKPSSGLRPVDKLSDLKGGWQDAFS
jgi:hypothetical protein